MSKNVESTSANNKSFMIGLICVMIVVLAALLGYVVFNKVSSYQKSQKIVKDFRNVMQKEELSIIYYMHTGCKFCEMEEPVLERIAKDYDLEYLTIDSSKLTKKGNREIIDALDIEGRTPTIVIVKNGEVKATQVGYLEGYKLVEFFVKAEVLDEKSTYKPEENLKFLEYEDFQELMDSKDLYTVILGSATCEYCKMAKPTLSNLAKAYDIPIYYFGLEYLPRNSDFKDRLTKMGHTQESFVKEGKIGTPTVLVIKNKKVVAYLEGYQSSEDYIKFLKENKVIKE